MKLIVRAAALCEHIKIKGKCLKVIIIKFPALEIHSLVSSKFKQIYQVFKYFLSALCRYLNVVLELDMPPNQQWHCNVGMTISVMCQYSSTLFILSMTFGRCYSIIRPHKAASFNTVKRAEITIGCIVFFSISFNSLHFFYTLSTGQDCFVFAKETTLQNLLVYYWISTLIMFIIPFVSLLAMNCFIIRTLRRRSSLFKSEGQGQSQGHGTNRGYDKQVYVTLLSVTFSFLVLNTTVYSYALVANIVGYQPKTTYSIAATFLFLEVAEKLVYTNYGINFFLYVISGPKFRNDLVSLFKSSMSLTGEVSEVCRSKTTSVSVVSHD